MEPQSARFLKDIDSSYKTLGLATGASEPEIRAAHKHLLDRIYPDLLSPRSSLRKAARDEFGKLNEAYENLMLHLGRTSPEVPAPQQTTSDEERPEPPLEEGDIAKGPEPQPEPLPEKDIGEGYIPPVMAVLVLLLYVSLFGIQGVGSTFLAIICGAAGWLAGRGLVRGVNLLNAPSLHRTAVAWLTAVLLFVIVISVPVFSGKSARTHVADSTRQNPSKVVPGTSSALNHQENREGKTAEKRGTLSGVTANPAESASFLDKGKESIVAGRYPEAIEALTRSIELDPGNAEAYNSRGVAYAYTHRYKKAMADYDRAIELNPDGDGAYYLNRGIVSVAQGNYQQAIMDYKKAAGLGNGQARDFFDSQTIVW